MPNACSPRFAQASNIFPFFSMKILAFGDLFGQKGRLLAERYVPELRARYAPDLLLANTENLTQGKGPVPQHLEELQALGFDAFTGGNHIFAHMAELPPILTDRILRRSARSIISSIRAIPCPVLVIAS
jgi:calcineurin-like phosphoesterase